MTHSFQFDPNTILGVAVGASLREIRDAYHQKSLKYHPDKGGDEWAFRMVARAYEILSTARVVNRAADEFSQPGRSRTQPPPQPHPPREPRANWSQEFATGAARGAATGPASSADADSTTNLKGWAGAPRSREGKTPAEIEKVVVAELLILRFELECSLDLFARSPEDRNLSCSLHLSWPVAELSEQAQAMPDGVRVLKLIGEAFKAKGVRKHALNKKQSVEHGRFEGWLTYPTAVMASEALEAFREAIARDGLELERQVREMAIPRQRG